MKQTDAVMRYFDESVDPTALRIDIADQAFLHCFAARTGAQAVMIGAGKIRIPAVDKVLHMLVQQRKLTRQKVKVMCACCGHTTARWQYSLPRPMRGRENRPNGTAARLGL